MAVDILTSGSFGAFTGGATGDVQTAAITNTTADYGTINSVSLNSVAWTASNVDDTIGANVRIMSGATVLADTTVLIADFVNTTSGSTNAITFGTIKTDATSAEWDAAVVEVTQTYVASMKNDIGAIQSIDAFTVTVDYIVAAGEDNLLADDVESLSELTTPTLVFVDTNDELLGDDVESLSELTTPTLVFVDTNDELLADDVESLSELTLPAVAQGQVLLGDDVQSLSELTLPTANTTYILTSVSVQALSELTTPSLTEGDTSDELLADDVESLSELTTPTLETVYTLTAIDVESVSELTTPTVTTVYALTANGLESLSELTTPLANTVYDVLAVSLESLSELTTPTLVETIPGQDAVLADDIESVSEVSVPLLSTVKVYAIIPSGSGSAFYFANSTWNNLY